MASLSREMTAIGLLFFWWRFVQASLSPMCGFLCRYSSDAVDSCRLLRYWSGKSSKRKTKTTKKEYTVCTEDPRTLNSGIWNLKCVTKCACDRSSSFVLRAQLERQLYRKEVPRGVVIGAASGTFDPGIHKATHQNHARKKWPRRKRPSWWRVTDNSCHIRTLELDHSKLLSIGSFAPPKISSTNLNS